MKMYLHKHCEGQILLHRAEAYVASDVQLRDGWQHLYQLPTGSV